MLINRANVQEMPLFLQILVGYALSGYLFIPFGLWMVTEGTPIGMGIIFSLIGIYAGICGTLFTRRWIYSREIYMSMYLFSLILLLATGASLFLVIVLLIIATPISMYLYKNNSVSQYLNKNITN